ncbi:type I restriction-modification system specificity subunit [Helicobacter fennelliae]|uniref:Type I restriction-modification system specificity subunit n=1 Tax=Helicobacter fennelliae TaxID=215 RepID=A0A2X3BFH9_9HELI|nr:restriction endonuclease subunit S [Helicobacter fennelliae]SQB98544.1 type I restriction-modification system specificity subunit [Helicobacter fennelliae]
MIVNLKEQHCENFLQSLHKEQWQEVRLGEVAEIKTDIWKVGESEELYIGLEHIAANDLKLCGVGSSQNVSSNKYIFRENDILFGKLRPYFRKIIKAKFNGICSTDIWVIRAKQNINQTFLFYFFTNQTLINLSYSSSKGTRMPRADWSFLSQTIWLFPPLTIQQKIAEILSSFDDKIDLLHRQNKTLESLALTLFRHYFIDNPNRSEWELGKLGDYVKIIDNRGKTPPFTTDITPYPLIEVNALSDDSMLINYDIVRKYVIKETYQNWFREHIKQYDILFSTVGSIGEVAMLLDNKGCIAQNVIGFRAREISPFYLYEWLKYMQQEIKEFDIGSVQPSIKVTHFVEKQIYKPDSKTLESFDKQMLLMTNKISHNAKQIQNLQAMRDMLLKAIFE